MKVVIGFGMRGVLDTTPELAVTSGYTWGARVQISQFWKAFGELIESTSTPLPHGLRRNERLEGRIELYERQLTQIHVMCIHKFFNRTIILQTVSDKLMEWRPSEQNKEKLESTTVICNTWVPPYLPKQSGTSCTVILEIRWDSYTNGFHGMSRNEAGYDSVKIVKLRLAFRKEKYN